MLSLSMKLVRPEFVRVSVGGNLDVTTSSDLDAMLDRLAARRPWQVTLELSGLRMIDTIGVGTLVRCSKKLKACGCRIHVGGLRDQPMLVLRLLGLDRQLALTEDAPSS